MKLYRNVQSWKCSNNELACVFNHVKSKQLCLISALSWEADILTQPDSCLWRSQTQAEKTFQHN